MLICALHTCRWCAPMCGTSARSGDTSGNYGKKPDKGDSGRVFALVRTKDERPLRENCPRTTSVFLKAFVPTATWAQESILLQSRGENHLPTRMPQFMERSGDPFSSATSAEGDA